MAEVKIQDVVDHLSTEMRRALEDAVEEAIDGANELNIDSGALYRAFWRAVGRKCRDWEQVPNHFVRVPRVN